MTDENKTERTISTTLDKLKCVDRDFNEFWFARDIIYFLVDQDFQFCLDFEPYMRKVMAIYIKEFGNSDVLDHFKYVPELDGNSVLPNWHLSAYGCFYLVQEIFGVSSLNPDRIEVWCYFYYYYQKLEQLKSNPENIKESSDLNFLFNNFRKQVRRETKKIIIEEFERALHGVNINQKLSQKLDEEEDDLERDRS